MKESFFVRWARRHIGTQNIKSQQGNSSDPVSCVQSAWLHWSWYETFLTEETPKIRYDIVFVLYVLGSNLYWPLGSNTEWVPIDSHVKVSNFTVGTNMFTAWYKRTDLVSMDSFQFHNNCTGVYFLVIHSDDRNMGSYVPIMQEHQALWWSEPLFQSIKVKSIAVKVVSFEMVASKLGTRSAPLQSVAIISTTLVHHKTVEMSIKWSQSSSCCNIVELTITHSN